MKTRRLFLIFMFFGFAGETALAEWKIDLSRRRSQIRQYEMQNYGKKDDKSFLAGVPTPTGKQNEVVILNTDKGFMPKTVRLQKGTRYSVHVVNVNSTDKNVSFIMDAFSEHHSTFYGKVKTFHIEPQKEGIFSFQCPETSVEGKLVVVSPSRLPASR